MIATELNRIERESGAVSANRFRATLSSFFNWAAREGLIDANPAAFTNQRAETPRDRVLPTMRSEQSGPPCRPVTSATLSDFCCSRPASQEIAELSWNEIDFERGLMVLPAGQDQE